MHSERCAPYWEFATRCLIANYCSDGTVTLKALTGWGIGGFFLKTSGPLSLKVVTNEKGEAVGDVLTIIC